MFNNTLKKEVKYSGRSVKAHETSHTFHLRKSSLLLLLLPNIMFLACVCVCVLKQDLLLLLFICDPFLLLGCFCVIVRHKSAEMTFLFQLV